VTGSRLADVTRYAIQHPAGISPTAVAAALGITDAAARTYLARGVASGQIARLARGLYGPPPAKRNTAAARPRHLAAVPDVTDDERNSATATRWRCPDCGWRQAIGSVELCEICGWPRSRGEAS
jgi:hypothetical protein